MLYIFHVCIWTPGKTKHSNNKDSSRLRLCTSSLQYNN